MRVWSIHPKYCDTPRLNGMWREGLLAKAVIEGTTPKGGYRKHSQAERLKVHPDPVKLINHILYEVWKVAQERGFKYDIKKLNKRIVDEPLSTKLEVTRGQIEYEFNFMQHKIGAVDTRYKINTEEVRKNGIEVNPCFKIVPGDIMDFEKEKNF